MPPNINTRPYVESTYISCQDILIRGRALGPGQASDDEIAWWQDEAAKLDPLAYVYHENPTDALDVTVPDGHTWFATNLFNVEVNTAIRHFFPLEGPDYRRAMFQRPLDARRATAYPAGTRFRGVTGENFSNVYACDPALVVGVDPRYQADPRGLYFERLQRLKALPVVEIWLEWDGGGDLAKSLTVDLPVFDAAMLIGASVYEGAWVELGHLNCMSEINNTHSVRFAESLLCPFMPTNIGGATITGQSGNDAGDGAANPAHGSVSICYQVLPSDW